MHRNLGLRGGGWCARLLCCSLFACVAAALAAPDAPLKQDRSWKLYKNMQWGYCVSYPSRWRKGDAFDGAGIFVETGAKKYSRPLGAMDVGALPEPESTLADAVPLNLVHDFEVHLDGLKKFERAESVVILDKRQMQIEGSSALFTKDRYYDPQDRATWAEEIIFMRHQGTLYRLELECRADQLPRFEPVFNLFVSTFRFDCAAE
jgi:hypothetical protein